MAAVSNSKVNLYINSKFRNQYETTSKMRVIIPSGLLTLQDNDYYSVSVNGFYMYNQIYQCNDDNKSFGIIFETNTKETYSNIIYSLNIGNPNVYNIRDNLNTLLENLCTVTYDKQTNLFVFKRTKAVDNNYNKMYIFCFKSGTFFGFPNNEFILITTTGTESFQPVNVIYHRAIMFNFMEGDLVVEQNSLDNIGTYNFKATSCLFYKNIDQEVNKLLVYDNYDANTTFQYKLVGSDTINKFTIRVMNQDGEDILDVPEWLMTLQFEKYKDDQSITLLRQIKEYLSYIFMLIANYIYPQ